MARPSTRVIAEHDLLNTLGINSIFNLQLAGEHAGCGDGNGPSGFSYEPQAFMDSGIFYYNFGWRDMDICPLEHMLNLVQVRGTQSNVPQVMCASLMDGKKIAVHCHAGLGRTGLSIACTLLYKDRISVEKAVQKVRSARPGSVQTRRQVAFVSRFEQYLAVLRIAFPPRIETSTSKRLSLETLMQRQRLYLHGMEQKLFRFVPRMVNLIMKKLVAYSQGKRGLELKGYIESFELPPASPNGRKETVDPVPDHVKVFEKEVNDDIFFGLEAEENHHFLVDTLFYWLHALKTPLVSPQQIALMSKVMEQESGKSEGITLMDREVLYTIHRILDLTRVTEFLQGSDASGLNKLFDTYTSLFTRISLKSQTPEQAEQFATVKRWLVWFRKAYEKGEDLGIEFSPIVATSDHAVAEELEERFKDTGSYDDEANPKGPDEDSLIDDGKMMDGNVKEGGNPAPEPAGNTEESSAEEAAGRTAEPVSEMAAKTLSESTGKDTILSKNNPYITSELKDPLSGGNIKSKASQVQPPKPPTRASSLLLGERQGQGSQR